MKKIIAGLIALTAFFMMSCKDDGLDVPNLPDVSLQLPLDNSNGVDVAPLFKWEASDPDGLSLTYDFYIGTDSVKQVMEAGKLTAPEYKLSDYTLKKDEVYYWCVYISNGKTRIKSDVWSFTSIPAPDAPVLVGPSGGSFVRNQLTFEWNAVPAGEGETIYYEVLFGDSPTSLEKVGTVDGQTTFTYDPASLEIGKVYYWMVKASDLINGSASEIRTIKKLMVGAPDEPMVLTPTNKVGLYDANINLSWTAVPDPESDAVSYDIYMDDVYPPTTLVTNTTQTTYSAAGLDANKPYYWRVVAKDASNHFTESAVKSFTKLANGFPGAPVLTDLMVDGMLTLDEKIVWNAVAEPDGQDVTYDVYLDNVYPPVAKLASDLTTTEYQIMNADLSCDITNVKTFYFSVVAKDSDGNETKSVAAIFKPQMTGVFTDVRADESNDYNWVRVGTQIWMSQNFRSFYFTDGSKMSFGGPTSSVKDDPTMLAYNEHPAFDGFDGGWPSDWLATKGRTYTSGVAAHELTAPAGWHVMDKNDQSTLKSYIPGSVKDRTMHILGTWHTDAKDTYGLNFETAGWRYNNGTTDYKVYVEGYRVNLEQSRADLWVDDKNFGVLEINPGGNNDGNRWRYFKYNTNMMFGIRFVKN